MLLSMLKMLIADDHPLVRKRIVQLLTEGFPSAFFQEAEDTTSLVNGALQQEWDIIISDLAMPGGGGMHALQKIKEVKPALPVLIISSYPEDQYGPRVVEAGAAAFIHKDNADNDLVLAIKRILKLNGN